MNRLYCKYFQKSRVFLYALLRGNNDAYLPVNTFVIWENRVGIDQSQLFAVFQKEDTSRWRLFVTERLQKSPAFLAMYWTADSAGLIVAFDLKEWQDDFQHFYNGRYSLYSEKAKNQIRCYYSATSTEWAYLESFLFPERYFGSYAELLGIPEKDLRAIGELCDPFNREKETMPMNVTLAELMQKSPQPVLTSES